MSAEITRGFYGGKFLIPHAGHVWCITRASTMADELHVVLVEDGHDEARHFTGSVAPIPVARRLRWLQQITADMPNVVTHQVFEPQDGSVESWAAGAAAIRASIGAVTGEGDRARIDRVFSSEPGYSDGFSRCYPEAEHVLLDPDRTRFPVSATMIRRDGVYAYWEYLPRAVRRDFVLKVAVVGSESGGKSTLVRNLARVFDTAWVGEYGREVTEALNTTWTLPEDYRRIAVGHAERVYEATERANRVLFVDTEAHVTRGFMQAYHGMSDPVVDAVAATQDFDLVLFLEPDVPWVDDGTRVLGEEGQRRKATNRLKGYLVEAGADFVTVSGDWDRRFSVAEQAVVDLLASRSGEVRLPALIR